MSIKIEGGKREQPDPSASELSISPGFIQEFMTQWVNTGQMGHGSDTQLECVSPGDSTVVGSHLIVISRTHHAISQSGELWKLGVCK